MPSLRMSHFDSGEQANARNARLRRADFFDVREGAAFVHAIGDGDGLRVVGDGDVFVAEFAAGFAHFLDGIFAVGGGGVHLQVAANVRELDEVGKLAFFGGFDFAASFAEFRLDIGELELGVNFFFGFAGDHFAAFQRGEGVLVERPAHIVGAAAQRDVVRLGAGEIHECGAEIFLAQQAQIDLQLAVENDADFVFAVSERLVNSGIAQQMLGNLVDLLPGCRGRVSW